MLFFCILQLGRTVPPLLLSTQHLFLLTLKFAISVGGYAMAMQGNLQQVSTTTDLWRLHQSEGFFWGVGSVAVRVAVLGTKDTAIAGALVTIERQFLPLPVRPPKESPLSSWSATHPLYSGSALHTEVQGHTACQYVLCTLRQLQVVKCPYAASFANAQHD